MVATVQEIVQIVRANPFIDGIGYFIEVSTVQPVAPDVAEELTDRMMRGFCAHSQVTLEGDKLLGFDFHEHISTRGDEGISMLRTLEELLVDVERRYGIDHLCIEFQFDMKRARRARVQVDDLLRP